MPPTGAYCTYTVCYDNCMTTFHFNFEITNAQINVCAVRNGMTTVLDYQNVIHCMVIWEWTTELHTTVTRVQETQLPLQYEQKRKARRYSSRDCLKTVTRFLHMYDGIQNTNWWCRYWRKQVPLTWTPDIWKYEVQMLLGEAVSISVHANMRCWCHTAILRIWIWIQKSMHTGYTPVKPVLKCCSCCCNR